VEFRISKGLDRIDDPRANEIPDQVFSFSQILLLLPSLFSGQWAVSKLPQTENRQLQTEKTGD